MQITNVNIKDIKPYENNPRFNDNAVDYVANSIKEFGFKVPVVLDKNNVIITGHTRVKACEKLGIEEIPCIYANDLTEEQVKAFRLADNKVGEIADWDFDLLNSELDDIELDMSGFGFLDKFNIDDSEEYLEEKQNERERTYKKNNFDKYNKYKTDGKWNIPIIKKTLHVPTDMIPFNNMKTSTEYEKCIHFYIDDYQFERIWNNVDEYIDKLKMFDSVLSPDFSLYTDMPMALKLWNVYRSRLIGQILQDNGVTVIPTIQWAEKETFEFCFDGIESGGTISVSTMGLNDNVERKKIWFDGMEEAIKRINPKTILVYGDDVGFDFKKTDVKYIKNKVIERERMYG